jgi:hypothetical protein
MSESKSSRDIWKESWSRHSLRYPDVEDGTTLLPECPDDMDIDIMEWAKLILGRTACEVGGIFLRHAELAYDFSPLGMRKRRHRACT